MMNDWFHSVYFPLAQATMHPYGNGRAAFFSVDNIFINLKNKYDCTKMNLACIKGGTNFIRG